MPNYRVTYLDIRHSIKHEVNLTADSEHIAARNGWDLFTLLREAHRYGTPLKDDYAIYSVVEIKDGTEQVNSPESDPPNT